MKKKLTSIVLGIMSAMMLSITACGKPSASELVLSTEEETSVESTLEQEKAEELNTQEQEEIIDEVISEEQEEIEDEDSPIELVAEKPYENASYSITISINPLVKLIISTDDQVLEVKCLNVDSEIAYSSIMDGLVGESAMEATKTIVQSAIQQGYLKDGASCTISCDDVWETSEGLVEQLAQIRQTVQNVLVNEKRDDAVLVMEVAEAVDILEAAGVPVDEEFKADFVDISNEDESAKNLNQDEALWPNLLFIMKPGQRVEEVVFLNDSANRAYAGVTQDVVDMRDMEAAKIYLAAAYKNGYLKEQFDYDGDPEIPDWIRKKLIYFRNYDEAIRDGIIPIPHEFWTQCPRVALLIDDKERITEVFYLNDAAASVFSGFDFTGQDPMAASGKIVSECYNQGYIRFTNIPIDMFEHIITVCNEEEAQQMGLK